LIYLSVNFLRLPVVASPIIDETVVEGADSIFNMYQVSNVYFICGFAALGMFPDEQTFAQQTKLSPPTRLRYIFVEA
jgi:hypothetical protein